MIERTEDGLQLHPLARIGATVIPIVAAGVFVWAQLTATVSANAEDIKGVEVRTRVIEDALTNLRVEQRALQVETRSTREKVEREATAAKEFRDDMREILARIERRIERTSNGGR